MTIDVKDAAGVTRTINKFDEVIAVDAHDAAVSAKPVLVGGYAKATAPTDVSADADAVRAWHLLNGAAATVITAAGALVGGDATNGLDVDVTRLPALAAGTNNIGDVDVLTIAAGDNNIGNVDIVTLPALVAGTALIGRVKPEGDEYETVAAGQTAQALGATGATGDYIAGVLVIPGTTSPGNVLLLDNATSITIFTGGATSVSNLVPFYIPLGITSVSGAWKITTGSNVTCIGMGNFT
jgi:hypothetical protein